MNKISHSLVNTTPSSLLNWLTEELDKRDIDTVYARYIVSLLLQDCADIEPTECIHNKFYQLKGLQKCCVLKTSFPFSKLKHQKFKKSAKQRVFMHPCLYCNQQCSDGERLKRKAAVECLQSTYHDVDGVEELVDQVNNRLKNLKNQKGEKDQVFISACRDRIENSYFGPASSSSSDIQKYLDDFPCLNSSEDIPFEDQNISIWDRKPFKKVFSFEKNTVHSSHCSQSIKNSNQPVIPYKFLKSIKNVYKTDSSLILSHDKALMQCSGLDIDNFVSSLDNSQNAQILKLLVNQFILMKLTNLDITQKLELPMWNSLSMANPYTSGKFKSIIYQFNLNTANNLSQSRFKQVNKCERKSTYVIENHNYSLDSLLSPGSDSSFSLNPNVFEASSCFKEIINYIATERQKNAVNEKIIKQSNSYPFCDDLSSLKSREPYTEFSEKYHKFNDKKWLLFWGENQTAIENIWLNDNISSKEEPIFDSNIINYPETWINNNNINNIELLSNDSNSFFQINSQNEANVQKRFNENDAKNFFHPKLNIGKNQPLDMESNNDNFSEYIEDTINDFQMSNPALLKTDNVTHAIWSTASSDYIPLDDEEAVTPDYFNETKIDWDSKFYFDYSYSSNLRKFAKTLQTCEEQHFAAFETQCSVSDSQEDDAYLSTCLLSKQNHTFKPKKPCVFYLRGECYRNDCRYSHDLSSITCRYWKEGDCIKGETCPFLHGETSPREESCKKRSFKKFKVFKARECYKLESEEDFPSLNNSEKINKSDPINIIQDKSSGRKKNKIKDTFLSV